MNHIVSPTPTYGKLLPVLKAGFIGESNAENRERRNNIYGCHASCV